MRTLIGETHDNITFVHGMYVGSCHFKLSLGGVQVLLLVQQRPVDVQEKFGCGCPLVNGVVMHREVYGWEGCLAQGRFRQTQHVEDLVLHLRLLLATEQPFPDMLEAVVVVKTGRLP